MIAPKTLQTKVIKSSSIQNKQNRKKISNTDISSAVPGTRIAKCELHRNSSFNLLFPLRDRAAVASAAGNSKWISVSLLDIPTPHCSSCPRTLFQSWLLPTAGAFVRLLSEANVSQDICSTWELFSQLEVTVHEPCRGGSRDFGKGILSSIYTGSRGPGSDAAALPPSSLYPRHAALPWAPGHAVAEIPFELE